MRYFEDYAFQLNLNIQYNTEIKKISRNVQTGRFQLMDQDEHAYDCQVLIMRLVSLKDKYCLTVLCSTYTILTLHDAILCCKIVGNICSSFLTC